MNWRRRRTSISCRSLALGTVAIALAISSSAPVVYADDPVHSHSWLSPKSHPDIDDHPIPTGTWVNPNGQVKFCVLCIHGLGLNSRSFEHFGKQLVKQGAAVYAIDVRGFGQWRQIEGHSEIDFANTLTDIEKTLQTMRQRYPSVPVFLLGESMGGAIALRAAAMYPDLVDGLVSSVPAGDRFKQTQTELKVATQLIAGGNKKHDIGKQVIAQATENLEMREHWENDNRNRVDFSAKELVRFQKFMNENHEVIKNITKTPVLLVQGCNDRLVKSSATFELFDDILVKDKTFLSVPYEHLIFEEQEHADKALNDTVNRFLAVWLTAHAPTGSAAGAVLRHEDQVGQQQEPKKQQPGTDINKRQPDSGYALGQPVHFHNYGNGTGQAFTPGPGRPVHARKK